MNIVKIKIADVVIALKSVFPVKPIGLDSGWRYGQFLYHGKKPAQIRLTVKVVDSFPAFTLGPRLFFARHPASREINWRLFRCGEGYLIKQGVSRKNIAVLLNRNFCRGVVYFINPKNKEWFVSGIIYDFLQVLLINFLSLRQGLFMHSVGLRDTNGCGYLFAGESGAGKSTTARIWYKYSRARILNDDRVIVRMIREKFYIYGTPWHGDFHDFLSSETGMAELKKVFFIRHARKHICHRLESKDAFPALFPNTFPVFWGPPCLKAQMELCKSLARRVSFYRLGFKPERSLIPFIRTRR
ncbi:MAG: hypothetical protein NT033_03815 [Candidatus Omnitrophica bacterium]|nr:hypothetical protein [Candidatus Omnitrophota bacterium]